MNSESRSIITFVSFIFIYIFLFKYFQPQLIFSKTTTSGGDTPSHHYIAYYLKTYLLPRFRITGWSPDWYAGFPFLTFYFPLPYLLIVFLSFLIDFVTAFKIVTILGVFLLPISTFLCMKKLGYNFPISIVASIFTLLFLFNESYTFYGGNIPSTLAGEFPYSLSLAIMVVLTGYLYDGIKNRKNLLKNSILFSLMSFSHLYTVSVFVFSSLSLLIKKTLERLKYMFWFYFFGISFIAFWLVPFIFYHGYMASLGWIQDRNFKNLYLSPYNFTLVLTFIGIIFGLIKKDERIFYLTSFMLVSLIYWYFLPNGHLFNNRYLPFYYLYSLLIASFAVGQLLSVKKIKNSEIFVLVILILVLFYLNNSISYIPSWIRWNYEGFESKKWEDLSLLFDYLRALPYGRVMHEYSPEQDKFGSPRTLESIPYFSQKPVMEGLLIESALCSPFHFWMQATLSKQPSCPISYVGCTSYNISKGYEYLRLFNVKYFVAYTDEIKEEMNKNDNFKLLKTINDFDVYEVKGENKFAQVLNEPLTVLPKKEWLNKSLEWFKYGNLDNPIVFDDNLYFTGVKILESNKSDNDCFVKEVKIENEELDWETSCIGKPILVKIPYFPRWKVEGADKIYFSSPCFMLIFPQSDKIKIYYGRTWVDNLSILLTLVGFVIFLYFLLVKKKL